MTKQHKSMLNIANITLILCIFYSPTHYTNNIKKEK